MAGWDQAVGGQLIYWDGPNGPEIVTDEFLEPIYADDGGGWLALSLAKTASVGEWLQANDWEASLVEEQPGVGGWDQSATWDASGLHAEPISAEATFEQIATWDAEALHAESQPVTAEGTWEQSETWEASVTHTAESQPPLGAATITGRARAYAVPKTPIPAVTATSSFGQGSEWAALITVTENEDWLLGLPSEALLVGA
jgi:hypothetical protein